VTLDAAIGTLPELLATLRRLEERTARIEEAITKPAPAPLEPLAAILGCSLDAARRRLSRDPELRKLAVKVGRRDMFRRGEVEAYFASATRPSLRIVAGGA